MDFLRKGMISDEQPVGSGRAEGDTTAWDAAFDAMGAIGMLSPYGCARYRLFSKRLLEHDGTVPL